MKTTITTFALALAVCLSPARAQETNSKPQAAVTDVSPEKPPVASGTWEIMGRTFASFDELTGYASERGFVVLGKFGNFQWPAIVASTHDGTNSISYRRKNGNGGEYSRGYKGFRLRTVTLEDIASNETIVVLRSKERIAPPAVPALADNTWEIMGRTFASFAELTNYASDGGFFVIGKLGDSQWPTKVASTCDGTNSISFARKIGQREEYSGYSDFHLKIVAVEDAAGNETIVALRSKEKITPSAAANPTPDVVKSLPPAIPVLATNAVDQPTNNQPPPAVTTVAPDKLSVEDAWQLMDFGSKLSAGQFAALEAKLQHDPKDLATRLQLLGHETHGEAMPPPGVKLLLGVIENNPRSPVAGPICVVISAFDQRTFKQALDLWQDHIKANPENAQILGNAATWMEQFAMVQPEFHAQKKSLFEKARALEPGNPVWAEHLGYAWLHDANLMSADQASQRDAAKKGIEQFETAYQLRKEKNRATYRMLNGESYLAALASASLLAGETNKAKECAIELLKNADAKTDTWNYGNVIYQYNSFLGLIALHEGKTDEAAKYLLAAGQTPGSPQLNSYGPDFTLAKELLGAGKPDVVLHFLDLVGNFWGNTNQNVGERNDNTIRVNLDNARLLERYRQEIRNGKIPDDRLWQKDINHE